MAGYGAATRLAFICAVLRRARLGRWRQRRTSPIASHPDRQRLSLHTPSQGTVDLRLSSSEGTAVLSVADSGPGISAEDLPHIFERFYRSDKSGIPIRASGRRMGAGLGLSPGSVDRRAARGRVERGQRQRGFDGSGLWFRRCRLRCPRSEHPQRCWSRISRRTLLTVSYTYHYFGQVRM